MINKQAIQLVEPFDSFRSARSALDTLKDQTGYLGGRILMPNAEDPDHRVQAFFQDDYEGLEGWLPDGCRRVLIPDGLRKHLGMCL